MVLLRPLLSSKQSFSLRWLRQCSFAPISENKIFQLAASLARSPLFENILFKEIFKGCCLLFSYQGSCRSFFATALIFYHKHFALSRTFLFFFSVSSAFLSVGFKRQLDYFITSGLVCQQLFSSFSVESFVGIGLILQPLCSLRSFRLRVSSRELCGFLGPCPQRQVLSYHQFLELSTFFLFFIYFRQFKQFAQFRQLYLPVYTSPISFQFFYIIVYSKTLWSSPAAVSSSLIYSQSADRVR